MSKRSWSSFGFWALVVLLLWVVAWIIAEAIPVLNDLLGLISALFASWFTYGLSGVFWLFLNRGQYFKNPRKMALTVLSFLVFLIGEAIVSTFLITLLPLFLVDMQKLVLTMIKSVELGYMRLASPSTGPSRQAPRVFLVLTIQRRLPNKELRELS